MDERAGDRDGFGGVGPFFGKVQLRAQRFQQGRLVGGLAVDEGALARAAEGGDEGGVDARDGADPVVVGAGEAVGAVEPGPHYDGRRGGEDGWVGEGAEEGGEARVRVRGVLGGGLRAGPEGEDEDVEGARRGEERQVHCLAGEGGGDRRAVVVLVGGGGGGVLEGGGGEEEGGRARDGTLARPALVAVEEVEGGPGGEEGRGEAEAGRCFCGVEDGGVAADCFDEEDEDGAEEFWQQRRAGYDDGAGGWEAVRLGGGAEDMVEEVELLLDCLVRPSEAS